MLTADRGQPGTERFRVRLQCSLTRGDLFIGKHDLTERYRRGPLEWHNARLRLGGTDDYAAIEAKPIGCRFRAEAVHRQVFGRFISDTKRNSATGGRFARLQRANCRARELGPHGARPGSTEGERNRYGSQD